MLSTSIYAESEAPTTSSQLIAEELAEKQIKNVSKSFFIVINTIACRFIKKQNIIS